MKNAVSVAAGSANTTQNADATKENRTRSLINLGGAVASGVVGTLIVNKLTRDIQDTNLDSAEKAAYNEWMDSIGKHIRCYIGADEVGMYGDIISTSME